MVEVKGGTEQPGWMGEPQSPCAHIAFVLVFVFIPITLFFLQLSRLVQSVYAVVFSLESIVRPLL